MNDITAIILTKNEEVNIERCIKSAKLVAGRVIVVDSGSKDKTCDIAKKKGAEVVFHEFKTHGEQFNWALDNLNIDTPWVLRLDADEEIPPQLAHEIIEKCKIHLDDDVSGFVMKFKIYFLGTFLKHGGAYPFCKTTIFKVGKGKYDERNMRDDVIIFQGRLESLKEDCNHYDFKSLENWIDKHNWYSTLEANNVLNNSDYLKQGFVSSEKTKKIRDGFYYRLPKFFRARLYFWYRYYIKFGFLDGKPGKIYAFLQAYWYRYLVDAKIMEREIKNEN